MDLCDQASRIFAWHCMFVLEKRCYCTEDKVFCLLHRNRLKIHADFREWSLSINLSDDTTHLYIFFHTCLKYASIFHLSQTADPNPFSIVVPMSIPTTPPVS